MIEPAAALRDRIAAAIRDVACTGDCGKTEEECARERIQPFVWHHGRLAVVEGSPEMFADVVLAVLSPPVDRAALRDRIRRAICEAEGFLWNTELLEPDEYGEVADAVLAVLSEPVAGVRRGGAQSP